MPKGLAIMLKLVLAGLVLLLLVLVWAGERVVTQTTSVSLYWTAPGDDGDVGTASVYDMRLSRSLMTEATFATDSQVVGEPVPQASGSAESFSLVGLPTGSRWFVALKAADEAGNWSALSNVLELVVPDLDPPATIFDLRLEQ